MEAGVEGKGWGWDEWMGLEEQLKEFERSEVKGRSERERRKRNGREQRKALRRQIAIRGY